ncbi:MAG: D-ala-D-ala transporter subunit, partial [candidate division NC10 bacterium]|nr:D-ala-D-ala transporter subunit [candidate division NC10 bacterium]
MDRDQNSQGRGEAGHPAVDALTVVSGSARESRSLWSDARARLLRNPVAMAGGIVVILLIVMAIVAPYVAPYDPIHQDLASSLAGPS